MSTEAPSAEPVPPQPDAAQDQDTAAAQPPASPPLPERPTAVSPGPRAARLQELYAQSLRHTLSKLAWDNLAGCYPTVARRAEPVLRQVQSQMVEKLGDKCEKEFDNIMTSRHVVSKLNDLETLVHDASQRRAAAPSEQPTPPHLLPPSEILAAHQTPTLVAHQSQLNARLQTTQSQNALLLEDVQRQRAEIDALLVQLEAAVADVRGANETMAPVVAQLAAEARQSDVDISTAQGERS